MFALVISSNGSLHNGLLALLTTIPQLSSVLVAHDMDSGLKLAKNHHPALIILDLIESDIQEYIGMMKEICPQAFLIVLVDDIDEQTLAQELGADNVLIRGFTAQYLIEIIESIETD